MWSFHVLVGLLVLTGINSPPWSIEAFNVETRHYTSYRGEFDSMFGFSVAEYRDRNRRGWVIVGAPQAQTAVANVYRGGAVYRCDVAADNNCTQLLFDSKEHNTVKRPTPPYDYMQIDNKTLQWFGATVSTSQQDGGPILACAPRYTFFGVASGTNRMNDSEDHRATEPAFGNQRDPVGTCFLEDEPFNHSSVREFSPCRTKNYGYHKQGSCQAGFSAALSKTGERLFVGAPGSWYWQGQIYTQKNRGKVMFTKEATSAQDDTYLGYSMTTGDFSGTGEVGTAVGNPRGAELRGQLIGSGCLVSVRGARANSPVVLLFENMTHIQNIVGEDDMGSYFGYALAAGDVDNDGLDDLIVGAPMFTVPDNSEMNFETGRIYVYYGKGPNKYTEYVRRDGESNRGRFGMSIAYLGDIDHDGYGDFAVGAPYAGPEGRGAVYIYQGSPDGLLEKYSQVIYGREVSTSVQTFGFSIAGGLDLDGNLYSDMVVGAYDSSRAMFFRSRPVIKMVPLDTYVQLGSSTKLVSLDDTNCVLSRGTPVTCLQLKTCFKYNGEGVLSKYNFRVQYVLDSKKTKNPRMCFLEDEGNHVMNKTIEAYRNQQYCRTVKVYLVPNIRDKLTSLDVEMRMGLESDLWPDNRPRNASLPLRPILARTSSRKDSVAILKNCGADNICTPDLQLSCNASVTRFLMGSGETIELEVIVQNAYEDAFEATYNLMLPPGIDYTKIIRIDKSEIPVQCSAPKQSNNNTLKCDIGNPLPKLSQVRFKVVLQPIGIKDEMSTYEFYMETNSSNTEPISTTHDNKRHISIKIWVNTELIIEGESKPKEVYYNPDNYTSTNISSEIEYGPGFVHNYTIRNRGPSRIDGAEVILVWPIKTLAGDDLFYLVEQPETSGKINCVTANFNAQSLKLEHKVRSWHQPHSPIPPYTSPDKPPTINEGPSRGGSSRGTTIETGGGFIATSHSTNSTRNVTYGPDGSEIIVEDDWSDNGGIIQSKNVSTILTEERVRTNYGERTREEQERIAYERRRDEEERIAYERRRVEEERIASEKRRQEEEEAKRVRQRPTEYVYGTERQYENSGGSTIHGASTYGISHTGGPVLATGIRTEDRISGDREETVEGAGFDIRVRNVTASQDVDRILSTLTRNAIGYEVDTREGRKYLTFLGRFRVSADGKEYMEFKNGAMFPLENRHGGQSYAAGRDNVPVDRLFNRIEGSIIITEDGKAFVQLHDGRRFPLQGSYSYTEEHTYTRGGGGRQGGSSFSANSEHHETTDSYERGNSWSEESHNREDDFGREVETHNTRTHEERRTYERKQGSRVYGRNEEVDDTYSDAPAQYRSGIHKRGSRYRREGDAISVEDFRKYEKLHRLHKRNADDGNDDDDEFYDGNEQNRDIPVVTDSTVPTCKGVHCVDLRCTVGKLEKDEEVSISARYRIKATTLQKIVRQEELKISTHLVARVTKLPFVGSPAVDIVKNHEIYTILKPNAKTPEPEPVPLWIVVLSACAGVIILLLLIFLLHKCGFFKRNRPTDAPERQPLNRNGHFHGDDHL